MPVDPPLLASQQKSQTPLAGLMLEIFREAEGIARDLNKPLPSIDLKTPTLLIENPMDQVLRSIFFQLLHNAIDHGIESVAERIARGKRPEGLLQLRIDANEDELRFSLQDDGHGLRLHRIRDIAEKQGLIAPSLHLDPQMIADQMFSVGISTADRGQGMKAVARLVLELEGSIRLYLLRDTPARGGGYPFALVMCLPLKFFKASKESASSAA